MKRVGGNSGGSTLFREFAEYARKEGVALDEPQLAEGFIERVKGVVKDHLENPIVRHGFRVQSMFAYVAACLGRCAIITEEDSGEFYATDRETRRPDFRVLKTDGEELLVEVKNYHQLKDPTAPYRLSKSYLESLQQYADAFGVPLRLAIYWSRWNLWSLVPPDVCVVDGEKVDLEMRDAMARSEMAALGDQLIGLESPLVFRVYTDPEKPRQVDEKGEALVSLDSAELLVGERAIEKPLEEGLAWFFLRYGEWDHTEEPVEVREGDVIYFDFRAIANDANPDQDFEPIGFLSKMISLQFDDLTADGGKVNHLRPSGDPEALGVLVPDDYKGEVLKLWRFSMQPRFEHETEKRD